MRCHTAVSIGKDCDTYQPHAVRRIYDSISGRLYDLRWDNAGNLGQISVCGERPLYDHGRFLFWTEDNRMHTSLDNKTYTYYVYDHSGERRLKMSGQNKVMDINANAPVSYTILKETTLYPSAYMVHSMQATDEDLDEFLDRMFSLAEQGHRVSIYNGGYSQVSSKERVVYTTSSIL